MNKQFSIRRTIAAASGWFLLTVAVVCCGPTGHAAERPNILIMIADDLCRRDLGFTGHPDVKTPNLDRLASQGLRLEGMFSPAASCSPLRHALYTGLHCVRSGAYPNHTRVYDGTRSIFTYLKELGYRVALQNKEHVAPPASFPYEHIAGADDLTQTAAFITREPQQPWMLVYCSNDPHSPWTRGPQDAYDPQQISVPSTMHDNATTRQALSKYYAEISQFDYQVGQLLQLLEDKQCSEQTLVMFVSEQGCSLPYGGKWSLYDTGIHAAALVRWPGVVAAGTRSDVLLQYTDVAPTLVEIAGGDPAAIDTGCPDADGNRGMDGKSFLSVLRGKTEKLHDYVFAQHTTVGVNGYLEAYPSRMVRTQQYKLIRNLAPENIFTIGGIHQGEVIESWQADAKNDPALAERVQWLFQRPGAELYDVVADPDERHNLADDPRYATVKAELQQTLDAWMRQQKDAGLETELKATERQGRANRDRQRRGGNR